MESNNRSPLVSGFGGAALIALFAAPLASLHTVGSNSAASPAVTSTTVASAANTPNFNSNGPWFAICREYLTTEDPIETEKASHRSTDIPGTFVHVSPEEAATEPDLESISELSRNNQTKHLEKFHIEKHFNANLQGCTGINKAIAVTVIIATVADPVASQMQLVMDRSIDAIGQAAAAEHYNFTSYWLPWQTGNSATSPTAATDEATQSRQQEPGVLIFRRWDAIAKQKHLLFVFLVGETPTSGINRLQMARALRDAHDITSNNSATQNEPLLISGPEFSGSYDSLAELLRASIWTKSGSPGVEVLSPATVAKQEIERFRSEFKLGDLEFNGDRIEQAAKLELTRRFGINSDQIAWLSEDQSASGASENLRNMFYSEVNPADNTKACGSSDIIAGALRLQYPRDISSLRNSSDPGALLVSPADLAGGDSPHRQLSLSLTEKSYGNSDNPPSYAANQEAIGVEAALKGMVEEMHERRIQAVVVTGSNPLDELYLLDYLRRNLPDAMLAVMEADEFLTTRPSHVSLIGTIVFTGLPLLPGEETFLDANQPSQNSPVTLSSSRATGTYVTMRLLLRPAVTRARAFSELGSQLNTAAAQGQASDKGGKGEGLPVEDLASFVVGRYGLDPLEGSNLFTHYPIGESAVFVRATINPFPMGWLFVLAFVAIFSFWHLIALNNSGHGRNRKTARQLVPTWAYPPEPRAIPGSNTASLFGRLAAHRRYYLYVACNQIALLQFAVSAVTAVLIWSFWYPDYQISSAVHTTTEARGWIMVLFLLNCVLLFLVIRESLVRGFAFGWGGSYFVDPAGRVAVFFTHFFPQFSVLVWISILTSSTYPDHWFRLRDAPAVALRCSSLGHGLSPFVPFAAVVVGYFIWAITNLNRLGNAGSRRVWVEPKTLLQSGPFGPSGVLIGVHRELHRQLESALPAKGWRESTLFILWIFALFFTGAWNATRCLDGIFFHIWILFFGMFQLLYVCATEIITAFGRWNCLKVLLDYLDSSSISGEFSAESLRPELASMRIWRVGSRDASLLLQSHTLDMFPHRLRVIGHKLVTAILKRYDSGLWVEAHSAQALSTFLNRPLADHAGVLDQPAIHLPWKQSARYLTLRYVALTRYALLQIRNGFSYVLWGFVAAVICIGSYPFQGEHAIGGFVSFSCLALFIAIACLLVQIERHPLLSRLEGTEAGKASFFQIAAQLVSIGGLPLIAVLASQFPALGDFLLSWVRPAVEAAH